MNHDEKRRVNEALLCADADFIPKVPGAGSVRIDENGNRMQLMHNGVLVLADGYYGEFMTRIIERMKGHHEPQEEKVFHEVLKVIPAGATMVELGSYWAYYSLWFHKAIQYAQNFMIEPARTSLECGRRNFALNGMSGDFTQARIARSSTPGWATATPGAGSADAPSVCVKDFARQKGIKRIALLHCDIQGFEYEMLNGCGDWITGRKIDFVFISTHSLKVHIQCAKFLARNAYTIIAEHTPKESYSEDGLVVGSASPFPRVEISKRPVSPRQKVKAAAFKLVT